MAKQENDMNELVSMNVPKKFYNQMVVALAALVSAESQQSTAVPSANDPSSEWSPADVRAFYERSSDLQKIILKAMAANADSEMSTHEIADFLQLSAHSVGSAIGAMGGRKSGTIYTARRDSNQWYFKMVPWIASIVSQMVP